MASGMIHLNGNVLCAIDVETTGVDPRKHDIIQICVLPLNSELKPRNDIMPFYTTLAPMKDVNDIDWQACAISKLNLAKIINEGMDAFRASDLLMEWFELKLKLSPNKRISPLAQNWVFDRGFLIEWLGPKHFEYLFDGRYRDTMAVANFCNDRADFTAEQTPYPKINLSYLASCLKVERIGNAHDALSDCIITAEVYRRMLRTFL